jgi:hypothetical protein
MLEAKLTGGALPETAELSLELTAKPTVPV